MTTDEPVIKTELLLEDIVMEEDTSEFKDDDATTETDTSLDSGGASSEDSGIETAIGIKYEEEEQMEVKNESPFDTPTGEPTADLKGQMEPPPKDDFSILVCDHCHKITTSRTGMAYHLRSHQQGRQSYRCTYCGVYSVNWLGLQRHLRIHERPYKCAECDAGFALLKKLQQHRRNTGHRARTLYKCEHCDKELSSTTSLTYHMRSVHKIKSQKWHSCLQCNKNFFSALSLDKHMRLHAQGRMLECKYCFKPFDTRYLLKRHRQSHVGKCPYRCTMCRSSFETKNELLQHRGNCQGRQPATRLANRSYSCDLCPDKTFTHISSLRRHQRVHADDKPHQCLVCDQRYITRRELEGHMRRHTGERPFECKECGKRYSYRHVLKAHMKSHTVETPFKCEMCDRRFTSERNLTLHQLSGCEWMENSETSTCPQCNKTFASRSYLKHHMLIHSDVKPFHCQVCDQPFRMRQSLRYHERIHTGEKPFECRFCHMSFRGGQRRNDHEVTIHMNKKNYTVYAFGREQL